MKKTVLIMAMLAIGSSVWAQNNPAQNALLEYGFVRIGEFQSTSRNNVGASAFLFPYGDKLVTGLHSSVSADDFLGGLQAVNSRYVQEDYNLVSYGWKDKIRGFHTVEIGAKADYGLSLPKGFFQVLKTGTSQSPYDFSSLRAFGNLYAEIAYSYALPLNEQLFIGARAKLLVGLNSVDLVTRQMALVTTEEQYRLDLDADIDLTNRKKKIGTDEEGYLDYSSFSGKGKLRLPAGGGVALDLGVVWKPFRGFTLSASVQDLGGILWYYGNASRSSGSYTFEGLQDISAEDLTSDKLLAKVRQVGEEVLGVIKPKAVNKCFKWKAVPLTAHMNVSYAMPFWERLSADASVLYTGHNFCAPYWEARGGLSVDFPECFHLGASAGGGAYGFVYRVNGSVDFLSFRLYASFENGIGGVIPYEGTPLKANNKVLSIGLIYQIQ